MTQIILNSDSLASSRPQMRFEDSSFVRRVTELAVTLLCGLWRTIGSYFCKIELDSGLNQAILESQKLHEGNGCGAIKELKTLKQVGPATVQTLCDELQYKHPNKIQVASNFLYNRSTPELPEDEGKDYVLVPVVVLSTIDHIVAVIYDKSKNRIEVFDSKGLACKDRTNDVRCNRKGVKLSDVVRMVAQTYGDANTTLVENTEKHQYDAHNCGIYVADYFKRRVEGHSHEAIVASPLSYSEANASRRIEIIRSLVL